MSKSTFYQTNFDEGFRFGDVVNGFIAATPNINDPFGYGKTSNCTIDLLLPDFCVILSPCCSIANSVISLSPLITVRNTFFNNPYFSEDLTRINRECLPEQTFPPDVWETLPEEEKAKRLEKGWAYSFLELFLYEQNDIFEEYTVNRKAGNINTRYYMIDFRNTFRVNCPKIKCPNNVPIELKVLQLTKEARAELRLKIAAYYARIPAEDIDD